MLGLTVGDKDGDEVIEEEKEEGEVEAPGVGAIEIDVLGLTACPGVPVLAIVVIMPVRAVTFRMR